MLYVSSSCLKYRYISEIIEKMVQHGIRTIELSGGTEYYRDIENDLIFLKQKYNLEYACHAYFPPPRENFVINLASCNDEIYEKSIQHYEKCIEMLRRIGCKILSIHSGFLVEISIRELGGKLSNSKIYDKRESYDRFCSAYEHIRKLCSQNGIKLFLENNVLNAESYHSFECHNYMMMTDYESIMEMKERLDFNLLLDLGHLYVSSQSLGLDYMQECRKLSKYVKWIHLSENNGLVDEHKQLKENSKIVKEFQKMKTLCTNITLETVCEISGILDSIRIISN